MKRLDLIRLAYLPFGTFGKFMCGYDILYTVERPWLNNAENISCIPEGHYICKPKFFFKHGYQAVEIISVPNRKNILFHIANWPEDVEGCVGIGKSFDCMARVPKVDKPEHVYELAVSQSTNAFKQFMDFYGAAEFELYVRQVQGAK